MHFKGKNRWYAPKAIKGISKVEIKPHYDSRTGNHILYFLIG
jgi:hypothetical protein